MESVRRHLITYDRRYGYRGPEDKIELGSADNQPKAIRRALATTASSPFMLPAVVLEANPKKIVAAISPNETVELDAESLKFGRRHLAAKPAKGIEPIVPDVYKRQTSNQSYGLCAGSPIPLLIPKRISKRISGNRYRPPRPITR